MTQVENISGAYYKRMRNEGLGVPAAYAAVRKRFGDKAVEPPEVDEYKRVLAEAYADHVSGTCYVPFTDDDARIASDLCDNLASFERIGDEHYVLTKEGLEAGRKLAHHGLIKKYADQGIDIRNGIPKDDEFTLGDLMLRFLVYMSGAVMLFLFVRWLWS